MAVVSRHVSIWRPCWENDHGGGGLPWDHLHEHDVPSFPRSPCRACESSSSSSPSSSSSSSSSSSPVPIIHPSMVRASSWRVTGSPVVCRWTSTTTAVQPCRLWLCGSSLPFLMFGVRQKFRGLFLIKHLQIFQHVHSTVQQNLVLVTLCSWTVQDYIDACEIIIYVYIYIQKQPFWWLMAGAVWWSPRWSTMVNRICSAFFFSFFFWGLFWCPGLILVHVSTGSNPGRHILHRSNGWIGMFYENTCVFSVYLVTSLLHKEREREKRKTFMPVGLWRYICSFFVNASGYSHVL